MYTPLYFWLSAFILYYSMICWVFATKERDSTFFKYTTIIAWLAFTIMVIIELYRVTYVAYVG